MQSGEYIPSKQGRLEEEHYYKGNMIISSLSSNLFQYAVVSRWVLPYDMISGVGTSASIYLKGAPPTLYITKKGYLIIN